MEMTMPVLPTDMLAIDMLAIVAKYPHPGQVKTRLGAGIGYASAAALYRAFLVDLAERFSSAGRDHGFTVAWACAPGPGKLQDIVGADAWVLTQRGTDLAERLYYLAVDAQAIGVRRLVIMSSDSPHVATALIRDAFRAIHPGQVVLGPAEDGGYYLIGFDATSGVPDLFRGIQMSTPHVLRETMARVSSLHFSACLLPETFDVDEVSDLERLAGELASGSSPACPQTQAMLQRLHGSAPVEDETAHAS
jgi:rSAM/selenodomain-associated transferase 1